ncbi:hypothetical protein [Pilimelia anulata]|nr:hypothetical protein [Pilimelia anulata]
MIKALTGPIRVSTAKVSRLWLDRRGGEALRWIHRSGGADLTSDDLGIIAELLANAVARDRQQGRGGE